MIPSCNQAWRLNIPCTWSFIAREKTIANFPATFDPILKSFQKSEIHPKSKIRFQHLHKFVHYNSVNSVISHMIVLPYITYDF